MASVFKPKRKDESGKTVKYRCWYVRFRNKDGAEKCVKGYASKAATEALSRQIQERVDNEKAGNVDVYASHRKTPLAQHVEDFRANKLAKGCVPRYVNETCRQILDVFAGCGFVLLSDVSDTQIDAWLKERRETDGLSIASSNHYTTALKTLGAWLHKNRRNPENPFTHLSKLNPETDVRHARRALSGEELSRLIGAAECGDEFRGLSGESRAMLYTLAAMTGLRASELASLTPRSFSLDSEPPTVTVEAACSKHRREDTLPLHADLVNKLRTWLAKPGQPPEGAEVLPMHAVASDAILWPGTWVGVGAAMVRKDLKAARKAWLNEVESNAVEHSRRDGSEFLQYRTTEGVADFHGLRHGFISGLARSGVHPKDAQALARHSTIVLTMDRYSHVGLRDMAASVASLPTITPVQAALKATGTAGGNPDLRYTQCSAVSADSCNSVTIPDDTDGNAVDVENTAGMQESAENAEFPSHDSNVDKQDQNLLCYRYTTGE